MDKLIEAIFELIRDCEFTKIESIYYDINTGQLNISGWTKTDRPT